MQQHPQRIEVEQQPQASFDDVPVGRKSNGKNMFLEQHPPGYVEQPVVQEQLPLEKRLTSKIWKLRLSALQELITSCQANPESISQYQDQFVTLLSDSNVTCQDKSFKLFQLYLKKPSLPNLQPKPILKVVIQKGLSSNKQVIVKHANNILVQMFDKGYKNELFSSLSDSMNHKNPKIPASCVDVYTNLLVNFGLKKMEMLKPVFRELQQYLETTSVILRNAIGNFYKEAFKWLGEGMAAFAGKLKKPLSEELEKFMKGYVRVPIAPLRQSESEPQEQPKLTEIDVYDLADPIDVISKFDQQWANKVLEIGKWSEKKEALDAAISEFSVPKIVPREHYHLISLLKKLLVDSNVAIQICGMKLCRALANGLRRSFSHASKVLSPLLLLKLRDKKPQILDESHKTLKSFSHSITLQDLSQGIKQGLCDKSPNMRVQILNLLNNYITKKDMKTMKGLLDILVKLVTDGAVEVREKCVEVLCEMKAVYGLGFFGDRLRDVQSQKLQKMMSQKSDIRVVGEEIGDFEEGRKKNTVVHTQSLPQLPAMQMFENNSNTSNLNYNKPTTTANQSKIDLTNPNESIRLHSYQQLVQRTPLNCYQILRKCIKESSPNILRAILTLMERCCAPELTREQLEFLMGHDWRKSKNFLSDFLQNVRIAQQCSDLIRQTPLLKQLLPQQPQKLKPSPPQQPLIPQLHNLLPSIMNFLPQAKLQGCQQMLSLIEQYKHLETDYSIYTKEINEICNVIKCRICDPDPEIVKRFIHLSRVLTRLGAINKVRGRVLLPSIIQKLNDQTVYLDVLSYMNQNLQIYPGYLFSHLPNLLLQQQLRLYLLSFIEANLPAFFKTADLKSFVPALFACLPEVRAERLLDMVVEVQGEGWLDRAVREMKVVVRDGWVGRWGLGSSGSGRVENQQLMGYGSANHQQPMAPATIPSTSVLPLPPTLPRHKSQRLRQQPSNPWPLIPSPTHILQLISILPQLPTPLCQLNTLLPVTQALICKVCSSPLLSEYSDIIVKWLFWRFQIERKQGVLLLLEMAKKMVAIGLQQIELIVLLAGLLGVVNLGEEVMAGLCELHRMFKQTEQQKVFRFWINLIKDSSVYADQILKILRSCFHEILRSELVELATYPAVRNNKDFIKYLMETYDVKTLQVYGFDVEEKYLKRKISAAPESDSTVPHHLLTSFKTKQLSQVLSDVAKQVYQKTPQFILDFHTSLLHSLTPCLSRQQIKPQIFIGYITYFTKQLSNLPVERQALPIARLLVFLLMDLDESKPIGHNEIIRVVNSAMLKLLEITPLQEMLQVMFRLVRQQLSISIFYNKTVAVMCKCICKLVKGASFYNKGDLHWLVEQILSIFDQYYLNCSKPETAIHTVFKTMMSDAVSNKGDNENAVAILKEGLERHRENGFAGAVFGEMVRMKSPKEPSKEEMLMNRLNMIKMKCGVEELGEMPNVWSKKG